MRVLLPNTHSDESSLCDAIAATYAEGARKGGHEVHCIAPGELRFDLVLRGGYHSAKPLEPDVVTQQDLGLGESFARHAGVRATTSRCALLR